MIYKWTVTLHDYYCSFVNLHNFGDVDASDF